MPKIHCAYQLHNMDCLKLFRQIPRRSVDAVIVDPPYGTTNAKWDFVIDLEQMWHWLGRVCKPNAAKIIMAAQPFTSILICSNLQEFKYVWTWDKVSRASGFLNANKQPLRVTEDIVVFYTDQPTYNPQMEKSSLVVVRRPGSFSSLYGSQRETSYVSDKRFPKNLIRLRDFENKRKKIHPTEKPVGLMQYLIKTYTDPGDTVLDFAMGSGTTGATCAIEQRNFIGCDNDTEHGYFEIASKRIKKAYEVHR